MDVEDLKEYRLPRHSWDYEHLAEPDHWFLIARAYLDCSHHLLAEMVRERLEDSFHHAKVAIASFEHAIELFLKGAIAQAGEPVPTHHRAPDLLMAYRRLYPGATFTFTGKIDEATSETAGTLRAQYARYPRDKHGQPWSGHTHIDLSIWYQELSPFKADFERLVPLLKSRYPRANEASSRPRA